MKGLNTDMANGKPPGARRNSQNNQAQPPEFELPRSAVLPSAPRQASASSSGNLAGDASIVNGIIEFADKEEYMDEP